MATIAAAPPVTRPVPKTSGPSLILSDIAAITKRNLIKTIRIPQLVIFSTIQPVMLLLLFTYVFGGVIRIPGLSKYIDYLVPAVLIQTTTFAAMGTGIGLATDLSTGMIDRFRSLPMARSAYLVGRTLADTIRMGFQIVLMITVAYAIGFRFHAGLVRALGLVVVCLLFGLAFSWISAFIGLRLRDPETAQAAGFIWVFPFIFASSAFAPVQTLPGWMQAWARVNPITSVADALRGLSLGGYIREHPFPLATPLWHTLAWAAAISLVFSTLAVRAYRKVV